MCNNIGVRGVSNTTNIIGNKKIKVNMQRAESEIKFVRVLFKSDFTIEILFTDFKKCPW